MLLPEKRKLWFKVDPDSKPFKLRNRPSGPKHKSYELDFRETENISAALTDKTDVTTAKTLTCNTSPQVVFQGQVPGHEAFVLQSTVARKLISARKKNREVLFPFLVGRDVVTGTGQQTRWVIDFQDIEVSEASKYEEPFEIVRTQILPDRKMKAEEGIDKDGIKRPHHQLFLRYWWRHSYDRPEMIKRLARLRRYVVCSGVTKRPIFNFMSSDIRPDHAVYVFAIEDDYSFGILQSAAHWHWFVAKCSKLKSDFRYTPPTVFDTFPWSQKAKISQIRAVTKAAQELRTYRYSALSNLKGGLRALYRLVELPGKNPLKDAHAALDDAVLAAYGFSPKKDLLQQLLDLNLEVAARIDRGDPVTAPGIPPDFTDHQSLITTDCICPP